MEKYYIKTGKENMQIEAVKKLLEKSYWAKNRTIETIEKSMEHSLCFGAFLEENNEQIGFARVITDFATMYYICDVIVSPENRVNGIGKRIVEVILSSKEIAGLGGILATTDAHELYRKYGFEEGGNSFMRKRRK